MDIKELKNLDNGYTLRVGKTSITIKDKNNKTRGIVNNIETFKNMQFNKKMEWTIKFNKTGINGKLPINDLVFIGNKIYYIHNNKKLEEYREDYKIYDSKLRKEQIEKIENYLILCKNNNIECIKY